MSTYKALEKQLKRQLEEAVSLAGTVFELPRPRTYADWLAKYKSHIRCMVWWDELNKPKPRVGRRYVDISDFVWLPQCTEKGEWRRKEPNQPVALEHWKFKGDRIVIAPALVTRKGYLLLDGVHRVTELEPRLLVLDWIQVKKEQLTSIADTIGAWWHE